MEETHQFILELPDDLEAFVQKMLDSGRYESVSEMVCEGLSLLMGEPIDLEPIALPSV